MSGVSAEIVVSSKTTVLVTWFDENCTRTDINKVGGSGEGMQPKSSVLPTSSHSSSSAVSESSSSGAGTGTEITLNNLLILVRGQIDRETKEGLSFKEWYNIKDSHHANVELICKRALIRSREVDAFDLKRRFVNGQAELVAIWYKRYKERKSFLLITVAPLLFPRHYAPPSLLRRIIGLVFQRQYKEFKNVSKN